MRIERLLFTTQPVIKPLLECPSCGSNDIDKNGTTRHGNQNYKCRDYNGNEQWVWLALDGATREIVGCYIGNRSGESAKALWQSLPPVYRQCAVCDSDFWVSYPAIVRPDF